MKILAKKIIVCMFLFFLTSCEIDEPVPKIKNVDYSASTNWVASGFDNIKHKADVFYVYPTVTFSKQPENMSLSNNELRIAARDVFTEHIGVFSSVNVFAPFYRQVSIAVLSLSKKEFEVYFSIAYNDVKSAFLYYLQNNNNGRPFILAGHSQGSEIVLKLMKDLFDDKELMKQLVASYIIGYSVTNKDLEENPWLKIAQSADDLGVIITYNTQSKDATGSPVLLPTAKCVNPLSWNTSLDNAPNSLHKGAVFFDDKHQIKNEIPNYTDAYIGENGALIASTPNPEDFHNSNSFFPLGVYHAYDYSFFYRNLEDNVTERVNSYINKH